MARQNTAPSPPYSSATNEWDGLPSTWYMATYLKLILSKRYKLVEEAFLFEFEPGSEVHGLHVAALGRAEQGH